MNVCAHACTQHTRACFVRMHAGLHCASAHVCMCEDVHVQMHTGMQACVFVRVNVRIYTCMWSFNLIWRLDSRSGDPDSRFES